MYDLLVASVWSRVILDFFAHLIPKRREKRPHISSS